ncbi:nSTAND1 domain-containing NTPase [Phytohabitans rumicis]|uniref:nSTAND1 domain-containing NTPase n=1 Tax=Phytohabitans rumicis TaxID=1076125 RepID=UPI001565DEC3|nr:trypsin-like peptidase domain-containing protein [Phytohabitans rumicis]
MRLLDREGRAVGAGCLAGPSEIITCAHVVAKAIAGDASDEDTPTTLVRVDFPFAPNRPAANAAVVSWIPRQSDGSGDVAGLRLISSPPASVRPTRLASRAPEWGFSYRVWGVPADYANGHWTWGTFQGATAAGTIQMQGNVEADYQIRRGFSGSPVWCKELRAVVGIVADVDLDRNARSAFLIPSASLVDAWPELRRFSEPPSPFRGLAAFDEKDAKYFHGREDLADRLAARVRQSWITVLTGASGSGKTSLLNAGLLPRLRGQRMEVAQWRPSVGSGVRSGLVAVLRQLLPEGHATSDEPVELVRAALANGSMEEVVLIIDQFEDILVGEPEQISDLDTLLGQLMIESNLPVRLVVGLRSDSLEPVQMLAKLAPLLEESVFWMAPITATDLEQVVRAPLAHPNMPAYEPGLDDLILRDAAELITRDAKDLSQRLPLIEFALSLLWERQSGGLLTHAAYNEIKGVAGALANHAERVWDQGITAVERDAVRRLLTRLVTPVPGYDLWTAPPVRMHDLAPDLRPLAQRLATHRLVTLNRTPDGADTVQLAHEALARKWDRLASWLDEERHFRRWQAEMDTRCARWESTNDTGDLLRGGSLRTARDQIKQRGDDLTERERRYIGLSLKVEKRRRGLVTGASAAFLVLIVAVASTIFIIKNLQGDAAERDIVDASSRLAQAATSSLVPPDAAALLAVGAYRMRPSPSTEGLLLRQYVESQLIDRFLGDDYWVSASADGQRVVTHDGEGELSLWDMSKGAPHKLDFPARSVWASTISRDGHTLALVTRDAQIEVWNVVNIPPRLLATFTPHSDPHAEPDQSLNGTINPPRVVELALNASGTTMAYSYTAGSAVFVRPLTGARPQTTAIPRTPKPPLRLRNESMSAWFDNDDRLVVQDNSLVAVFDPTTKRRQVITRGATVLDVGPGGQIVACSEHEDSMSLGVWDARTGRLIRRSEILTGPCNYGSTRVIDIDGTVATTEELDGSGSSRTADTLYIWRPRTNEVIASFPIPGSILEASFKRADGQVGLLGRPGGNAMALMHIPSRDTLVGAVARAEAVAFTPDGKQVLAWDAGDRTLSMWETVTRRLQRSGQAQTNAGHSATQSSHDELVISPDGQWAATADSLGDRIQLWRLADLTNTATIAVSPTLAGTGELHIGFLDQATFAATRGSTVAFWRTGDGKPVGEPLLLGSRQGKAPGAVLPRPNHPEIVAWWPDGTTERWSVTERRVVEQFTLPISSSIALMFVNRAMVFDPSGRHLAYVTNEGQSHSLHIRDIDEHKTIADRVLSDFAWIQGFVSNDSTPTLLYGAVFSSVVHLGTWYYTAPRQDDHYVEIGADYSIEAVNANGSHVVTTDLSAVHVTLYSPEAWIERLCAIARPTLTDSEREYYRIADIDPGTCR